MNSIPSSLIFVLLIATTCEAKKGFHKAMPESEPFDRISTDYVSPHIKWAKPFVGGKLRVLVLASLMRHRETVELFQRLDMDFDTMITSGPNEFIGEYFFLTREETLKLNMSKLTPEKKYDVIIIAVSWFILPKEMKLEIARRVKAGTGALFTDSNGYKAFMEGAPKILEAEEFKGAKVEPEDLIGAEDEDDDEELEFDEKEEQAPPTQSAGKFVRLSMTPEAMQTNIRISETTFGLGRVVSVYGVGQARLHSSTPALMPKVGMEGERRKRVLYEFHTAHLAKAVVYTAQKEPKATIHQMRLRSDKQPLTGTPRGLTLSLKSEVPMPRLAIDLMVFDELRNERMRQRKDVNLRRGENTIELDMPFVPEGGRHFIAARLMQGDKVVSWDAISVKHRASNSARSFEFQPFYRRGERITGRVSLRGLLTEKQSITIEIIDNLNRVLHRQSAEEGEVFAIDAPASTALVPMHHVRAVIREGDVTIFDYDHSFLVQMPPVDNYNYVLWTDTSHYYYRQLLMDRYDELGVTAATPSLALASSNLRPWPYITRLAQWRESIEEQERRIQREVDEAARKSTSQFTADKLDETKEKIDAALDLEGIKTRDGTVKSIGPVSNPCYNDPKWVEQITQRLQKAVRDSEPFSPVGYSLGDENMINLTCHSEHCIREFRAWLTDQFKAIGTLNDRYGSQFKDWSDVMWPAFAEAKTDSGKLALWYDRQRFTDWTFNSAHLVCRRAVHSVAPGAPVGFSSFYPPQPERGLDALRMFPWATFNNQYQDLRWEDLMRAFSPRNAHRAVIQGTYSGYKHRLEFVCYPWLEFFRGANG
ncbi:MAG: beta-galactosidase, partial [Planctomycetota bacterium]|nr:beta-galactosidase [Planctomycetota bacterium]